MFGTFQQSNLRIEIDAPESLLREVLTRPHHLRQWLWPQTFSNLGQDGLKPGESFTSWLGPLAIHHQVDFADRQSIRFLLSRGIDGFHAWYWGDGWVQSNLAGVSALPLNLGQTLSLLRLCQYVRKQQASGS
jgi:hypothetical protein